MRKIQEIIHL